MTINFENLALGTLSQDSFVMVNKRIAQTVGFIEAGILGELVSQHRKCKAEKSFYEGNWFYLTQPSIEKNLGIKRSGHDIAIKNLAELGLISKKRMGLPSKNFYELQWDKIVEVLSQNDEEAAPLSDCRNPADLIVENQQTRLTESSGLDCRNPAVKRIINNNHLIKEREEEEDERASANPELIPNPILKQDETNNYAKAWEKAGMLFLNGFQTEAIEQFIEIDGCTIEMVCKCVEDAAKNARHNKFGWFESVMKDAISNGCREIWQYTNWREEGKTQPQAYKQASGGHVANNRNQRQEGGVLGLKLKLSDQNKTISDVMGGRFF